MHDHTVLCGTCLETVSLIAALNLNQFCYRIFLNRLSSNFRFCLTDHSRKARGQTKQRTVTILHHNNAPINVLPHYPPLRHIWGYSGDLTQPNVKCPIVGQTYRHRWPQLQRGIYSGFDIAKEVTTKNIWVLTERSSNTP